MKFKKVICLIVSICFVSLSFSCAKHARDIIPKYTSESTYKDYSCQTLNNEITTLGIQEYDLTIEQDQTATSNVVFLCIGLFLFWPALVGMLIGDNHEVELANTRGQLDAMKGQALYQNCNITTALDDINDYKVKMEKEKEDKDNGKD